MDQLQRRLEALEQQMSIVYCRLPWGRSGHRRRALMTRHPRGGARLWAIGLVLGWLTAAVGQTIQCGDTLGPGGVFQLQADIDCGDVSPTLTVQSRARLDLGGHTITSTAEVIILVVGHHAVLQNGSIVGGSSIGMILEGRGGHTVQGIDISASDMGIIVRSDHNRLLSNRASGSIEVGIIVSGTKNLLDSNIGMGQGGFLVDGEANQLVHNLSPSGNREGFLIYGDKNLLISNVAIGSDDGILIRGNGNRVVGSTTIGNLLGIAVSGQDNTVLENLATNNDQGVWVSGEENRIVRNTALANTIDLVGTHGDCDGNLWQQNVFRTSQAGSIANPACIQ